MMRPARYSSAAADVVHIATAKTAAFVRWYPSRPGYVDKEGPVVPEPCTWGSEIASSRIGLR